MQESIQEVKRTRHPFFKYVFVPTLEEAEASDFTHFVYCYETKLLISCQMGMHYLAIQEHLMDFLERTHIRVFDEPIPYPLMRREFTKEEIALMDKFIMEQLYLYGTDRYYGVRKALYD